MEEKKRREFGYSRLLDQLGGRLAEVVGVLAEEGGAEPERREAEELGRKVDHREARALATARCAVLVDADDESLRELEERCASDCAASSRFVSVEVVMDPTVDASSSMKLSRPTRTVEALHTGFHVSG